MNEKYQARFYTLPREIGNSAEVGDYAILGVHHDIITSWYQFR